MKSINLLGSTGSIGVQSLDVARARGYKVEALAAFSDVEKIEQQKKFRLHLVATKQKII